jgi:phenylalanine ammonia-lyase
MPLSYVVGGLEDNPDILIQNKDGTVLSAPPQALKEAGLEPVTLGPKD